MALGQRHCGDRHRRNRGLKHRLSARSSFAGRFLILQPFSNWEKGRTLTTHQLSVSTGSRPRPRTLTPPALECGSALSLTLVVRSLSCERRLRKREEAWRRRCRARGVAAGGVRSRCMSRVVARSQLSSPPVKEMGRREKRRACCAVECRAPLDSLSFSARTRGKRSSALSWLRGFLCI